MPVTTLDAKTALVVIDLQEGIKGFAPPEAFADVIKQAAALTAAFRAHHLPVVLVNVTGGAPGRNEDPPRAWAFPSRSTPRIPRCRMERS